MILNSKEYQLPLPFKKLGEISSEIYRSLAGDNHQYVVQSKVSDEAFGQFILYLTNGKEPEIHINNLFELQRLSSEFDTQEIKGFIQNKISKWQALETQFEQ